MAARPLLCAAAAALLCAAAHSAPTNCTPGNYRTDSNGIKYECYQSGTFIGERPVACVHAGAEHKPNTEWLFEVFVYSCYSAGPNALGWKIVKCALPTDTSVRFAPGKTVGGFECLQDAAGTVTMKEVAAAAATCTYGNHTWSPGGGASGLFLVRSDSRTTKPPQVGVALSCVKDAASASGARSELWGCALGSDPQRPLLDKTIRRDTSSVYALPEGDGKTYKCVPLELGNLTSLAFGLQEVTGGCRSANGNTYKPQQKWVDKQTNEVFECRLEYDVMNIYIWGCAAADGSQVQYGNSHKGADGVWRQCWDAAGACAPTEALKTSGCFAWRTATGGGAAAYCTEVDGSQKALGLSYWQNGTSSNCAYDRATQAPKITRNGYCWYAACVNSIINENQAAKCGASSTHPDMYGYCHRSIAGDANSMMVVHLLSQAQYVIKFPGSSWSGGGGGSGSGSGGNLATTTAAPTSATTSTANVSQQKCYSVPAGQPAKDHANAGESCALAKFNAMADFDKMVADSAGWTTPGARVWIDGRLQECGPMDATTTYMRGYLNGTAPECLAYDTAAKGLVFEQCAAAMHFVCEAACATG